MDEIDSTANLPDEIVQLILSFMSLKEAVRSTCLLATAWSSLWKPMVVDLGTGGHDQRETVSGLSDKMKQLISGFLKNHDVLRKLKISACRKNVLVATKGFHDELHIDFSDDDKNMPPVITESSGGKSAAQFVFESPPLSGSNQDLTAEISPAGFHSVKILHLRSINAGPQAENFVSSLLPSCRSLEILKLEKCEELRHIKIVMSASGGNSLRVLELSDCPNVDSMIICAPDLKSLHYAGVLPTTIQLQGTPNLVDVKFDVGSCGDVGQTQKFDCEQLIDFLSNLKEAEGITISGWIIEWMCCAGVIFGRLDFKLSRVKKIQCVYSTMDAQKRDSLACFLNIAPNLEVFSINMDEKRKSLEAPFFHEYWHEPHLWMDYKMVKSSASHLAHLKIIRIFGFSLTNSKNSKNDDRCDELLMLMDLLLHKALNLKAMIVDESWLVSKIPSSQAPNCQQSDSRHTILVPSMDEGSLFVFNEREH